MQHISEFYTHDSRVQSAARSIISTHLTQFGETYKMNVNDFVDELDTYVLYALALSFVLCCAAAETCCVSPVGFSLLTDVSGGEIGGKMSAVDRYRLSLRATFFDWCCMC